MKTENVYIGTIMECGNEDHFTREYKRNTILIKVNEEEYVSLEEIMMNKAAKINKKYNYLPIRPVRSGCLYVDYESLEPFFEIYEKNDIKIPKRIGAKRLRMASLVDPRVDTSIKQ